MTTQQSRIKMASSLHVLRLHLCWQANLIMENSAEEEWRGKQACISHVLGTTSGKQKVLIHSAQQCKLQ